MIAFSGNTACFGDSTLFSLKSQISNLKSFKLIFGDGDSTVGIQNFIPPISHLYSAPGIYFATLYITNKNNCSSSLTQEVNVVISPEADFVGTDVCLHFPTVFTDKSFSNTSVLDKWVWNFGDGIKDTIFLKDSIPNYHTYKNPGKYNVSLTVTDTNLCSATVTEAINVDSLPVANFVSDTVCRGNLTAFTEYICSSRKPSE